MVSDSADNIFDRLKEIVDKRRSSIPPSSQPIHHSSSTHPDLIIEENPHVIGDEPEKKKAYSIATPKEKKSKKKSKKEIQDEINARKERKNIMKKLSKITSALKKAESKPSKSTVQKIVSQIGLIKDELNKGLGKEKKNNHKLSELEKIVVLLEKRIKNIHNKKIKVINPPMSKNIIKHEITKNIKPLKNELKKDKEIEKKLSLLAKSQKEIMPIIEKLGKGINKKNVLPSNQNKNIEKITRLQEKSTSRLDNMQSEVNNGKERELNLANAVKILAKTQEEISQRIQEINGRMEKSKEAPKRDELKISQKSFKKEKTSTKKEKNVDDVLEQEHKSVFEEIINETKEPSEKLHASIFETTSEKIEDESNLSPFHESVIEDIKKKTVGKVQSEPNTSIEYNQTVKEAMQLMLKSGLNEVPVTQKGSVIGSISKSKIADYFYSKSKNMSAADKKIIMQDIESLYVSRIMNTKPSIVKPTDTLHSTIKQMVSNNSENAVVVSDGKPKGIITRENISRQIISTGAPEAMYSGTIETGFDKLLAIVERTGKISTEKAARELSLKRETIESWASILEDHGLIKVEYPIVGTIELIKK